MIDQVQILGCHSATPRSNAYPSAQVVQMRGRYFLVDCGEATQMRLREQKVSFSKIKHIFISHLHGDHYYGLIGLISTFSLLNRNADLHIYGPKGIKQITLLQLKLGGTYTKFNLFFHELDSKQSELIFEDDKVKVSTIPLDHRIYTNGFLFEEKPKLRKLNMDVIGQIEEIEVCDYENLKKGKDFSLPDGSLLDNKKLTFDPEKPKKYAYLSDTTFKTDIIPLIEKCDLIYHEATFMEGEAHLAEKTKHSTAKQAAKIAEMAKVKKLIIGHYSNRYEHSSMLLNEAKSVFENTVDAYSGLIVKI